MINKFLEDIRIALKNAIKELGSGVALYKDDILSRLKNML